MEKFVFELQRFDNITNTATNKTITGTSEADSITNSGNVVSISVGEGYDTVNNSGNLVTITGGTGRDYFKNSGDNVIITGNNGADVFDNSGGYATMIGDSGNDYVTNSGENAIISLGGGADTVRNAGSSTWISAGEGNDYIANGRDNNNRSASNVTIVSGAGNDTIYNGFPAWNVNIESNYVYNYKIDNSKLYGGEGDDLIFQNGDYATIDGGAGNDRISLISGQYYESRNSKNVFINYTYGEGDDTIYGFDADDTLQITTPVEFSTLRSGTDLYFLFDEGSITLQDVGTKFGSSNLVTFSGGNSATPAVPKTSVTVPTSTSTTTPASNSGTTNITNIYNTTNITNVTNITKNYVTFSGGGNQTISDFVTGRTPNSNVLNFATALTALRRSSSMLVFNSADGSVLHVHNSSDVDEVIQYSTDGENISYAKVGRAEQNNSFTYEDSVNFYSGGEFTDVLRVTNIEGKNIFLNGYTDTIYQNINNIDASNSSGSNTLAGDAGSNAIIAGGGNDSLWGSSGDDTLIGGTGENMFWFGKGDGHDVAQNVGENDVVNLYDVTLSDIISAETSPTLISINLVTGSVLDVKNYSSSKSTFKLADGSVWSYNRDSNTWQSA